VPELRAVEDGLSLLLDLAQDQANLSVAYRCAKPLSLAAGEDGLGRPVTCAHSTEMSFSKSTSRSCSHATATRARPAAATIAAARTRSPFGSPLGIGELGAGDFVDGCDEGA
jgi:hypothetical protein